jgi:hypothetical protein
MIIANKAKKHIVQAAQTLSTVSSAGMSSMLFPISFLLSLANDNITPKIAYQDEISKHRMKLPLYDLYPRTENNWIAPNATISIISLINHFSR